MKKIILILSILLNFSLLSSAQVIFVDQQATGSNNGTSWANAFTDLQDALENANTGVSIWVAQGTYYPSSSGDRFASFELKDGVNIYGGFQGIETAETQRSWEDYPTILSGDFNNDDEVVIVPKPLEILINNNEENAYNIVTAIQFSGETTIDGFYIKNGNANEFSGVERTGSGFFGTNKSDGQAIFNIYNCTFENNSSRTFGGAFRGNSSGDGHLFMDLINVHFNNNRLIESQKGGAVCLIGNGATFEVAFKGCSFMGNYAGDDNSGSRGGAVNMDINVHATFESCLFANNRADNGGATFDNVSPAINTYTNCTFYGNRANDGAHILNFGDYGTSRVDLQNCIFGAKEGTAASLSTLSNSNSEFVLSHCLFEEQNLEEVLPSTNNYNDLGNHLFELDPLFIDIENQNFQLKEDSPAINKGNNDFSNYEKDFYGNNRIFEDFVDIGAHEFTSESTSSKTISFFETIPLKIYPNPFQDKIYFSISPEMTAKYNLKHIKIFNIEGKLMFQYPLQSENELDLANLPKGTYVISIIGENSVNSKTIIKH